MLKRTPLNSQHKALGGRMVEFGGWEMPVQYRGVIEEHLAVRSAAGLFDVSHMGEIEVFGPDALAFLQELTVNDVSRLVDGQVQYSAMCYPHGGVVDDITLYRFSANHYLLCVNASNIDKDFAWMEEVLADGNYEETTVHNRSDDYAQLALQGPAAVTILQQLASIDLSAIATYHFAHGMVYGVPTLISRTGYTGEDGFELYCPPDSVATIWQALLEEGEVFGLMPIGLGARDTLRLEKKYALYGHELSPEITPLEAGLGWITRLEKPTFVGREALLKQKKAGVPRRLVGLRMNDAGIPRADYPVFCGAEQVGVVTSGTMSPALRVGIALALVKSDCAALGTALVVGIRNKHVAAEVVRTPFV